MAVYIEEVIDYFVIAQGVTNNQHYESVSDFLAFGEGEFGFNLHETTSQVLTFIETLTYTLSTHKFITQQLDFFDSSQRIKEGYAYQNLTFTESMLSGGKQWQTPSQQLVFTETVVLVTPKSCFDTLLFNETLRLNYSLPKSITQTLNFNDYAVAYLETERFIAIATPTFTKQLTVTFSGAGAGTITLPAPDFGNTEAIGQTRIQRQTRGGDYVIWRDPMWPTTQEFDLTFSFLNDSKVSKLQQFVQLTCGKLVSFVDHDNQSWNIIITSPEVQIETTNYPKATIKALVVKDADA